MDNCWDHTQTHLSGSNGGGALPPLAQLLTQSPTLRTPTIRSVVNVPPRANLSLSMGGAPATSVDDCKEDDGEKEAFHQFYWRRVQQSGMWKEAAAPPPPPSDVHFPQQESPH